MHFLRPPRLNDGGLRAETSTEEKANCPSARPLVEPVQAVGFVQTRDDESFDTSLSVQMSWLSYTATTRCHPRHVGAWLDRWGIGCFPSPTVGRSGMPVQWISSQSLCCCGPKMQVKDATNKCAQTRLVWSLDSCDVAHFQRPAAPLPRSPGANKPRRSPMTPIHPVTNAAGLMALAANFLHFSIST